jgi:two-component system response regulator FlrC
MPNMDGLKLLEEINCRLPVILITAYGTVSQAVSAMQKGANDFLTKPFSPDDLLRVVDKAIRGGNGDDVVRSKGERSSKVSRPIITNDPYMIRLLEVCEAVARSDATILIQGESGTGKELIARLIHTASPRSNHPFVAVNCAALPETLLESELFGHEKGAFTGAQARKIGKFELAHGGTILLDEISEMDLLLQAKLLRVLQEREVDRVGGKEPIKIDVRVLATTNRDLKRMVDQNRFRADLYYRLNVIPLTLPPLRNRVGDVRLLVNHYLSKAFGNKSLHVPDEVFGALLAYPWPGNVRELQNAVERAALLALNGTTRTEDFLLEVNELPNLESSQLRTPFRLAELVEKSEGDSEEGGVFDNDSGTVVGDRKIYDAAEKVIRAGMTVHEVERELILATLKSTGNNRTHAAKLLGISIRTLRNKLHEYRV